MGLSGKFWTWQHLGATPDIVCFGKKSQGKTNNNTILLNNNNSLWNYGNF